MSDENNIAIAGKAAGLNALAGGGLGVLPLGAILKPIAQRAPDLARQVSSAGARRGLDRPSSPV
jgi:hypothetical protein